MAGSGMTNRGSPSASCLGRSCRELGEPSDAQLKAMSGPARRGSAQDNGTGVLSSGSSRSLRMNGRGVTDACYPQLRWRGLESLYRPDVLHPVKVLCYAAVAELFTSFRCGRHIIRTSQSASAPGRGVDEPVAAQSLVSFLVLAAWAFRTFSDTSSARSTTSAMASPLALPSPRCCAAIQDRLQRRQVQSRRRARSAPFPSSGTPEADILRLSSEIDNDTARAEDLPTIAEHALGSSYGTRFPAVYGLLEGVYHFFSDDDGIAVMSKHVRKGPRLAQKSHI
ncbi:hypothetical protein DFH11DRAFT_1723158 [Phellopilus nigrolimitatus]|nr:hypothetical protein DFH11DRAFT_1723158 [Phellopilus nigrolimitatus]